MKMTCNIHPSIFVYITSTALKRSQFVYGRWYPTRYGKASKLAIWHKIRQDRKYSKVIKISLLLFMSTHQNYKKYGFSVAKRRAVAKLEKNCKLLQALMLRQIAWLKLCRPAGMQKDKFIVYCREHQAASRIKVIPYSNLVSPELT